MPENLKPGLLLGGRFQLEEKIGHGATGQVWRALDTHLHDEEVACKVLNENLAHDPRSVSELKHEVLLSRRLRHPAIVAVYTFWEDATGRFITMEYISGHTLAEVLDQRKTPRTLDELLPWLEQLCGALDYAHSRHVLHRDVKPANILLGDDAMVRLVDFGIARTLMEGRHRLTGGKTSGTVMYMSPEQLRGEALDSRSDLYSLASSVYELLNGHPPFHRGEIATQVQMKHAAPIAHLPNAVNRVILRGLSKNPADRPATCGQFHADLAEAARQTEPGDGTLEGLVSEQASDAPLHDPDAPTLELSTQCKRIGDILVGVNVITPSQLQEALDEARGTSERLGAALIRLGYTDATAVARALEAQLQIPFVSLTAEPVDEGMGDILGREFAEKSLCLPLRWAGERLVVAMADPLDFPVLNQVESSAHAHIDLRIATEADIREAIKRVYPTS